MNEGKQTHAQGNKPTVKMTIYLPEATRKALRIRAIEEGTSATKLVEQLILDYLKRKPKDREGK